tara:strand:+ start:1489 stop:2118 length:630 start_codon:yes stop_codon:yes gene_type:complete
VPGTEQTSGEVFSVLFKAPVEEEKRGTADPIASPQASLIVVGHNERVTRRVGQESANPVHDVGGSGLCQVGQPLVEPVLFGRMAESVAVAAGQNVTVLVCENVAEAGARNEAAVQVDHVRLVGKRSLEVGAKIGSTDKPAHSGSVSLQCPKAGGQQDRQFAIVVDVGRRADKTVATRHDGGFHPGNDRGGEFKISATWTGGFVQIDGAP